MKGMTSYAQVQKKAKGLFLEVILRSQNSKYLEIITRQFPPGKLLLEELIKNEISKRINRGKIEIYFSLKSVPKQKLVINNELLSQYFNQIRKIEKMLHISHTSIVNNLLLLPGIIRIEEEDRDDTVILSVFKEALDKLVAS
ncbi:MAG: hypothetical protein NC820_00545, partial [Candidatus Omnitrophica bacterium]|nr:hypothetical protein [Candidatus Omnitrophota bacterium]